MKNVSAYLLSDRSWDVNMTSSQEHLLTLNDKVSEARRFTSITIFHALFFILNPEYITEIKKDYAYQVGSFSAWRVV